MKNLLRKVRSRAAVRLASLALLLTLAAPATALAQVDGGVVEDPGVGDITTPDPIPDPKPNPVAERPEPEPAPAPSAEAAPKTALGNLSAEIMNVLVPTLVALIGSLAAFLLNWVRKRFKLTVSDNQIDAWAKVAERAADRGGEWARNKVKDATDGKKVPGPEVLEVAVNWAVEMGKTFKLPEMGREKLEGLIEGHLFKKRPGND